MQSLTIRLGIALCSLCCSSHQAIRACHYTFSSIRFIPKRLFLPTRPVPPMTDAQRKFHPRDPCGPRPDDSEAPEWAEWFLPARPVRAATVVLRTSLMASSFLSARLVRAATGRPGRSPVAFGLFLSTRPGRAVTGLRPVQAHEGGVSIRATRAGRDHLTPGRALVIIGFYPRGLCEPRPGWMPWTGQRTCFYPHGPCGPRPEMACRTRSMPLFLSARPVRAATRDLALPVVAVAVSIRAGRDQEPETWMPKPSSFYPLSLCGPRPHACALQLPWRSFLPARPVRAATSHVQQESPRSQRFYPRGPCGPRLVQNDVPNAHRHVSIRATRAGHDRCAPTAPITCRCFYPHDACSTRSTVIYVSFYPRAPCGRDIRTDSAYMIWVGFLSARPVRAATPARGRRIECLVVSTRAAVRAATCPGCPCRHSWRSFYPRGPCGPRPYQRSGRGGLPSCFYPRGPCGPRPAARWSAPFSTAGFYPRGPCGPRRSSCTPTRLVSQFLSARPVRAATPGSRRMAASVLGFYPRGPCGPRPFARNQSLIRVVFLSARPVRAATHQGRGGVERGVVSIRAARAGRDAALRAPTRSQASFYPRGPCGPRLGRPFLSVISSRFLSARPVRAATRSVSRPKGALARFYPRGPCGPRRGEIRFRHSQAEFLSARPVRAATAAATYTIAATPVSIRAARAGRDATTGTR